MAPLALRVLACTVPGVEPRLRAALPEAEIRVVYTIAEAIEALRGQTFDLLVIGMRFDESRALELVRRIHSDSTLPKPPMAGIRGAKLAVRVAHELFDIPMRAMGAGDVIDAGAIPNDEAGNQEIRERLLRCCGRAADSAS